MTYRAINNVLQRFHTLEKRKFHRHFIVGSMGDSRHSENENGVVGRGWLGPGQKDTTG